MTKHDNRGAGAKFEDLARRLLSVRKADVDEARKEAKRQTKRKPRTS